MEAPVRSVTALKRWSCQDKALPLVESIKSIHVYDFDNTLFSSPLPNKQIWNTTTFGLLQGQDFLYNGGWWHNPDILSSTGQGMEVEESRAWEGCWNEKIVDLVRLSMAEEHTLNVLLTGRSEAAFIDLIQRMISSKGLSFHMICLKPTVAPSGEKMSNTMEFKQALLRDMIFTYTSAEEIRMYEDRPKHTKAFRDFFEDLNSTLMSASNPQVPPRKPITAEVIQVTEADSFMDPTTEVEQVQRMINTHNEAILAGIAPPRAVPYKIKRSVFYTGYLISPEDTEKLKSLIQPPVDWSESDIRPLANNILITPRPAPRSILNKVGGVGATMRWRVTGLANQDQRVWAARVAPTVPGASVYTENATPYVVLATRRQTKPIEASKIRNWQPVPEQQAFEFDTVVGEKVLLRIDEELPHEDEYEASFPNSKNARKHSRDEDFPPLGSAQKSNSRQGGQPKPQQSGPRQNGHGDGRGWEGNSRGGGSGFASQRGGGNRGGRGGHGNRGGRGNQRGGRGGGRGRGQYRSLDANVGQGYGGGSMEY